MSETVYVVTFDENGPSHVYSELEAARESVARALVPEFCRIDALPLERGMPDYLVPDTEEKDTTP